jgi:hypothetical protein
MFIFDIETNKSGTMRNLIFTMALAFIIQAALFSQCLPEGITFTTQEQIDNFQTNYPGYTEIEGDVNLCGFNSPTHKAKFDSFQMPIS